MLVESLRLSNSIWQSGANSNDPRNEKAHDDFIATGTRLVEWIQS